MKRYWKKNDYTIEEIDMWIFSQFSKPQVYETLEKLNVDNRKTVYVGDKYGYTGVTSPFFALYEGIKNNSIQKGNKIILSSVGAGYLMSVILYII